MPKKGQNKAQQHSRHASPSRAQIKKAAQPPKGSILPKSPGLGEQSANVNTLREMDAAHSPSKHTQSEPTNTNHTDEHQDAGHMEAGAMPPAPSNSAVDAPTSSTNTQQPPVVSDATGGTVASDEGDTSSEDSDSQNITANMIQSPWQLDQQRMEALYPEIPKVTGPPRGLNAPVFPRLDTAPDVPEQRVDLSAETSPHLAYFQQQYSAADDDDDIASRPLAQPEYKIGQLHGINVPLITNQTPNQMEVLWWWFNGTPVSFTYTDIETKVEHNYQLPASQTDSSPGVIKFPDVPNWLMELAYHCVAQRLPDVYDRDKREYNKFKYIELADEVKLCTAPAASCARYRMAFSSMTPIRALHYFTATTSRDRTLMLEDTLRLMCSRYIKVQIQQRPKDPASDALTSKLHIALQAAFMTHAFKDENSDDMDNAYENMTAAVTNIWPLMGPQVTSVIAALSKLRDQSPFNPSHPTRKYGLHQHHSMQHRVATKGEHTRAKSEYEAAYEQLCPLFDKFLTQSAFPSEINAGLRILFEDGTAFSEVESNLALPPNFQRLKVLKQCLIDLTEAATPQTRAFVPSTQTLLNLQWASGYVAYGKHQPLPDCTQSDAQQFDYDCAEIAESMPQVERIITDFHKKHSTAVQAAVTIKYDAAKQKKIDDTARKIPMAEILADDDLITAFTPYDVTPVTMKLRDILPQPRLVVDGRSVLDYMTPTHRAQDPFPVQAPVPFAQVISVPTTNDLNIDIQDKARPMYIPPYSDHIADEVLAGRAYIPEFEHGDAELNPWSDGAARITHTIMERLADIVYTTIPYTPNGATKDRFLHDTEDTALTHIGHDPLLGILTGMTSANTTISLASAIRILHANKGIRPGNVAMLYQLHEPAQAEDALNRFREQLYIDKIAGISCDVIEIRKNSLRHRYIDMVDRFTPLDYVNREFETWAATLIEYLGFLPACAQEFVNDQSGEKSYFTLKTIAFAMKNGLVFECTPTAYMTQTTRGYVSFNPLFAELLQQPSVYSVSHGVHLVAADYALLDAACMQTFGHNISTHVIDIAGTVRDDFQFNPTTRVDEDGEIVYSYHTPSITLLSAVFLHKDIHHTRNRSVEHMLPEEVEQAPNPDLDEVYNSTMHRQPLHPVYRERMSDTFDINLPTDMTAMHDIAETAMAALDVFQIICVTTTVFRTPDMAPIKLTVHTVASHFDWPGGNRDAMSTSQPYTRLAEYLDHGIEMPTIPSTRITPVADAFAAMFMYLRQLSMNYALVAPDYDVEKHGTQVFQSILANATQWMVHQTNAILSVGTDRGRAMEHPAMLPHMVMDMVTMFNHKARAIFPLGEQSTVLLSTHTRDLVETLTAYNTPNSVTGMRAAYQALNIQLTTFDPPFAPTVYVLSMPLQWTGYPVSQTRKLPPAMNLEQIYPDMTFTVLPSVQRDATQRYYLTQYKIGIQVLQRNHVLKYLCDN